MYIIIIELIGFKCISECGDLYTWGWNDYGQLGHGDTLSRDLPTIVQFFKDLETHKISAVVCGFWNSVVIVKNK